MEKIDNLDRQILEIIMRNAAFRRKMWLPNAVFPALLSINVFSV